MLAILGLGNGELIIILFILLLMFGATKLPQLAKGLGKSVKEFKKAAATNDDDADEKDEEEEVAPKQLKAKAKVAPAVAESDQDEVAEEAVVDKKSKKS